MSETPEEDGPRTLTITQVADALQVSWDTAVRMARSGELPAFKVRSSWRVNADEFERWRRARARAETSRRQRMTGVL